jgi:hypothetical protein
MHTSPRTRTGLGLVTVSALLLTAAPVWAQAQAQAPTLALPPALLAPAAPASMPRVVSVVPTPGVVIDATGRSCSHWWLGHEADIEAFLREAPVVRVEDIPVGVTKPRRAYFEDGALVGSMAWKVLTPKPGQRRRGYEESHKAEIAAYRLSRLLGMHMVPPVVERRMKGQTGAAVMWIENVRRWDVHNPPRTAMRNWSRQVSRMKLFDQLIANIDRNQGNLLHDGDGHLFLIDHSRAFTARTAIKGLEGPTQVDRVLWSRIDALTREDLDAAVGDVLTSTQITAMLKRRELMRKQIDDLVQRRGEAIAFLPPSLEEMVRTGTATPHAAVAVRTPTGA